MLRHNARRLPVTVIKVMVRDALAPDVVAVVACAAMAITVVAAAPCDVGIGGENGARGMATWGNADRNSNKRRMAWRGKEEDKRRHW